MDQTHLSFKTWEKKCNFYFIFLVMLCVMYFERRKDFRAGNQEIYGKPKWAIQWNPLFPVSDVNVTLFYPKGRNDRTLEDGLNVPHFVHSINL